VITVSPVKDATGRIIGASKIAHDNSERKRAEQNLAVVMRELSHRSKNLLSIIVAMAQQTANLAPSIDSFLARFNARIQGLAKSHDLLIQENWSGALLRDLVLHQLRPFSDDTSRIAVDGPCIIVTPDAAQTIGLALHELGTNATKYGALSVPKGKVLVQWAMETVDSVLRFRLTWRERGGPPVKPPQRSGFGRRLIEDVMAQKFNAKVALTFATEGVAWTVDAAAADVLKGGHGGRVE
jgi:two-component sensor histidine kinase